MHISFDVPKQHSATCDNTYKDPQNSFIDFFYLTWWVLGLVQCQGWARCILKSLEVTFGQEIENPCENFTFRAILILWKKFGLLWFLGLCLVKTAHFWTISTKIWFCSTDPHLWTKVVKKQALNSILYFFWYYVFKI